MKVGSWKSGNMQLKFSKKSLSRDSASILGGSGRYTLRWKMSRNTSGFHCTHLFSSLEVVVTISWNERSPVFSLTHWMPLGEKSEYPEEEPDDQRRTSTSRSTHRYNECRRSYSLRV